MGSYRIDDENIPVGWVKVFEIELDPEIEGIYRASGGAGSLVADYLARCGEEFNKLNPHIKSEILVVLERTPVYMPITQEYYLPRLSVGIYMESSFIPKVNTFSKEDVSWGGRPVRITDVLEIKGKPGAN